MSRPSRYPKEPRERAVRLVLEHREEYDSEWAAIGSIAAKLGIGCAETLRKWARQAQADGGMVIRAVRGCGPNGPSRCSVRGSDERKVPMQRVLVNEVSLAVEEAGSDGPAVLFVHGGWTDRHAWDAVAPTLADRYRVICYDRRGHSQSERPVGNHGIETHGEDLAGLIDQLGAAPAHVVTNSIGGNVALAMAVQHADHLASLWLHEPVLLDLVDSPTLQRSVSDTWQQEEHVRESIRREDREVAARHFFDQLAVGPGTWALFPEEVRQTLVNNAPAWLQESPDAYRSVPDEEGLRTVTVPVLLTGGGARPPDYPYPLSAILDRLTSLLPNADRYTFEGAGHVPHHSHPQELAQVVSDFLEQHAT